MSKAQTVSKAREEWKLRMRFLDMMRRDRRVSDQQFRVGAEIFAHVNWKDGFAYPSHQTICDNLGGKDRSGVLRATNRLVELGYFRVVPGRGRKHSNRYFPMLENVDEIAHFAEENVDGERRKCGPDAQKMRTGVHKNLTEHLEEPCTGGSAASAPEGAPPIGSADDIADVDVDADAKAAQWAHDVEALGATAGLEQRAVDTYLRPLKLLGVQDGTARLKAPGRFFADWVEREFGSLLRAHFRRVGAERLELVV